MAVHKGPGLLAARAIGGAAAAVIVAGTAAVWKYRAIYRYDDARAGEWSDIVTCAVKG